ncbi:hypothetical protein EN935_11790 [Mesorhizobium sp. M7D.F.Ca.US.004.03.1.1]|uniref:hypothetical protein n=1 Tax=Mesorhizobium sp. M7D.F.Ca.US.004.03.1.1 TaxID=2496702 RepID=UPI000FC9A190|nr:hypothetical protein [Mesorhizobium sp. M7D.F.Ca.US.004.03.1.1]RVA32558.1 hypothetical protein EN935_11790 [Mesorhizobium sp. M7D.F.Ca.US.004.03.1.1]
MSDGNPYQIEHNSKERRPTNAIWWVLAVILAVNWIGYLYFNAADVWALAVGGGPALKTATCCRLSRWPTKRRLSLCRR